MLALVFAALGLLSLRPFCGLAFATPGHSDYARAVTSAGQAAAEYPGSGNMPSGTCCDSITDGTLVKSADPLISWTAGTTPFAFSGLVPFVQSRDPVRIPLAVPPERSYYVRSARILR